MYLLPSMRGIAWLIGDSISCYMVYGASDITPVVRRKPLDCDSIEGPQRGIVVSLAHRSNAIRRSVKVRGSARVSLMVRSSGRPRFNRPPVRRGIQMSESQLPELLLELADSEDSSICGCAINGWPSSGGSTGTVYDCRIVLPSIDYR